VRRQSFMCHSCMPCHATRVRVCALQANLLDLTDNLLTGPAFPPAWLAPGALPDLKHLALSGNANLTGTLPANLPGTHISTLWVALLRTLLTSQAWTPYVAAACTVPNAWRRC
jgi:hypothetical protein